MYCSSFLYIHGLSKAATALPTTERSLCICVIKHLPQAFLALTASIEQLQKFLAKSCLQVSWQACSCISFSALCYFSSAERRVGDDSCYLVHPTPCVCCTRASIVVLHSLSACFLDSCWQAVSNLPSVVCACLVVFCIHVFSLLFSLLVGGWIALEIVDGFWPLGIPPPPHTHT